MTNQTPTGEAPRRRRWRRVLYGSALAYAISLIFLWLPFVGFVTGPIGPMVGGYVVGTRFQAHVREGLLMGLGMGLMAGLPNTAPLLLSAFGVMDPPAVAPSVLWMFAVFHMVYITALGVGGTIIGGYLARKEREEKSAASG